MLNFVQYPQYSHVHDRVSCRVGLDSIVLKQANKCVCVVSQGVNKSRPVPAVPTVPESEPYPDAG